MKTIAIRLISIIIALSPLPALAQTNIKAAFDAIIKCSDADISASHSLEKDPETKIKNGQDDIYEFVLPANKMNLIKKALAAFDKDIPNAYAVKSGKNKGNSQQILLHSEQSGISGIAIDNPGYEYIYALFLPSKAEDPEGKYRYAYAMNYKEVDGQIRGKLVINYATTLKHRQSAQGNSQFFWQNGTVTKIDRNGSYDFINNFDSDPEQQTWFEMVMACINGMAPNISNKTNIALATKAYRLIREMKNYPEVTDQDKNTLRQIFKKMSTGKYYHDDILLELLRQCETAIK